MGKEGGREREGEKVEEGSGEGKGWGGKERKEEG